LGGPHPQHLAHRAGEAVHRLFVRRPPRDEKGHYDQSH
jgi:hypothetical protein